MYEESSKKVASIMNCRQRIMKDNKLIIIMQQYNKSLASPQISPMKTIRKRQSTNSTKIATATMTQQPMSKLHNATIILFSALATITILISISQVHALSLISEKCDPSKVGPDETTVKGGWQAEIFNGLAFRACDKTCMPEKNRDAIVSCFKAHSARAYNFYEQCTRNNSLTCSEQNKQELHFCFASMSQQFVQQEKCGQILNEATVKCLTPQLSDQIELCFIRENVHRSSSAAATTQPAPIHANGTGAGQLEVIVQSPKPARAFLKQFEYANYDSFRHACDPELEFDQQITSQEMTEIQAFYTIASTLCRDECLPEASKKQMRDCLLKNSPQGAKVYNQCTSQLGQTCTAQNEESLTSCFNTIAQNYTMNEKCVELVSDETQKCWSNLIRNETTFCVERKNLQTVSFEYGKICNTQGFTRRVKEEQAQIVLAHKTNQENLLRRALEIMCFPNCVNPEHRGKMVKCLEKESPLAHQIYANCSKNSKIKCDMDENIETYAEYVNCIYTEADQLSKAHNNRTLSQSASSTGSCVNLVNPNSFKCLESLYPNEIFYCPDVKVFHEAQAEAISHHAAASQLDEYDYGNN